MDADLFHEDRDPGGSPEGRDSRTVGGLRALGVSHQLMPSH